jgi:signal transduction histidine kinase
VHEYFLEIFDLETKTSENFEPINGGELFAKARPTYIFPSSDSTAWYCTKSGLFNLDIVHNKILHLYLDENAEVKSYDFPVSYNLSGPHVWLVHDSDDGKAWIGMDGDGLNVLHIAADNVEHFTTADGLPNNTVVGILPDSTGYWISTFKGLTHYDTASSQFRNYYRSNGIAHDEFNRFSFMKDGDGKYYFGSMNGVTSFYPNDVLGRPYDLKLFLSEIFHYDKKGNEISTTGSNGNNQSEIHIPSSNRFLSVKMCLNDFNNPQGNRFFYRIENVGILPSDTSDNWSALGMSHELRFETLEAGRYRLHLKGISAQGVESDEVVLFIRVNQYFYKTWWFGIAILVAFISAFYSLHVFRLRQAMKMEKLRTRLSSDLHDDVGGLLSGIALQMDVLGYTVGDEHKSLVQRIAQTSRAAMEKMRDVVWAIDAREAELHDLKARMLEFAEEVLGPLDMIYLIEVDLASENALLRSEIRHNFLLIFKEFVNNTVKHANASRVEVKFIKAGKMISMIIRDNGRGFDIDSMSGTGQGIRNMRMRTEQMDGAIEFLKGKGFGISVQVPMH